MPKKEDKKKKSKKHTKMTYKERVQIEILLKIGTSIRDIAKVLGRSPSTISEEIRTKKVKGAYIAEKAHHKAYVARYNAKKDCLKVVMNDFLLINVTMLLDEGWSPERIAGRMKEERNISVSKKAIYKFARNRKIILKARKRKGKWIFVESLDKSRNFIDLRPEIDGLGHFEGDFIVSKKSKYVLLVIVDIESRYTYIRKLKNRKHQAVLGAFLDALGGVEVKSLTLDNDIAFKNWKDLEEKLNTKIYFTHPYRSWEKGLVENTNLWIRKFVPKGSDIKCTKEEDIKKALRLLNHAPRQCLNFKTTYEVYFKKVEVFGLRGAEA